MRANMSDNTEAFWMVIYKSRVAEINERDSFLVFVLQINKLSDGETSRKRKLCPQRN